MEMLKHVAHCGTRDVRFLILEDVRENVTWIQLITQLPSVLLL